MTLMSLLLLIILFLVFFIYFSGLNPQDITIFLLAEKSVTYPAAIVIVGCVLLGLVLGYGAHVYSSLRHLLKHWKKERSEKKAQEVSAIYREGVGRLLSGDIKKARVLLQKALERDPSRVDSHIALANVCLQEGNIEEAINLLLKAKSIEPNNPELLFKLADTYKEATRDEEAAKTYEAIIVLEEKNRKALRGLRDLHLKENRWREALDLQKRILKAGPSSRRIEDEKKLLLCLRYEVARQTLEEGQIDTAITSLKEIAKESPDFVAARVSLGDAYKAKNHITDAAGAWQAAYESLGRSVFLSRLEDLYMDAEDPANLLSYFRSVLNKNENDMILRLHFGKLCLRLEMVDEALEHLYTVENTGAQSPQLHLLLAEAHRRRNRTEEAIEEYQKALGVTSRLRLDYVCENCEEAAAEWQSRCPACGTWGSFILADRNLIHDLHPLEVREIHHGERDAWKQE